MPNATFRDHFKLVLPDAEKLQEFKDSVASGSRCMLRVVIEATHAGITNKNFRFYIPSRMRDGAERFVQGKPAPILKHHKSDEDPIGKVRAAEYVDTTPEQFRLSPEVTVMNDCNASLKDQVKAARKFIQSGITRPEEWKGLGNTTLYADIIDEKAIRDLETGLFDAVSIGFSSPNAFCSICQSDWMNDEEGICEHFPPGKEYKIDEEGTKERQYLIPGDMIPRECSLVNFDADPHTNIILAGQHFGDSQKDIDVKLANVKQEHLFDANMTWEVRDFEEAATMKTIKVNEEATIELSDLEEKVFNVIKKSVSDVEDAVIAEKAKEIAALSVTESFLLDQKDAELDEDTAVLYAYQAMSYDGEELNESACYDEVVTELQKMVDEKIITQEEMEDSKLSTEQRKSLSEETFCGPGKSFPISDCSHATATRRLIGRYKGPGNKIRILASVNRKAKALGCNSQDNCSTSQSQDSDSNVSGSEFKKMTDKEIRAFFHSIELELIDRNLTVSRECSECATNLQKATDAENTKEEAVGKLTDNEQILVILRDELRNWASDYKSAINDSVEIRFELNELKKEYAAVASVLTKKQDNIETAQEFFGSAEDFDKEYDNLLKDFDAKEIFDKMNDGTHHEPNGTVDDPTINSDADNNQHPEGLSKPAQAVMERVKEMIEDKDVVQAQRLFNKMQKFGVLRDSMDFETIVSTISKADN